jgi:hypothetical protein
MEHPTWDEQMIAIGRLVQNAAIADAILFSLFRVLSGLEIRPARAIFFTFDSQPPRKRMIERLVGQVGDEIDKAKSDRIISFSETVYKQRNELAHALLLRQDQDENSPAFRQNPKHLDEQESTKPVTYGYLEDLRRKSHAAVNAALEEYGNLCQKRGVPDRLEY